MAPALIVHTKRDFHCVKGFKPFCSNEISHVVARLFHKNLERFTIYNLVSFDFWITRTNDFLLKILFINVKTNEFNSATTREVYKTESVATAG